MKIAAAIVLALSLLPTFGCAPALVGFVVVDSNTHQPIPNVRVESHNVHSLNWFFQWSTSTVVTELGRTADDGTLPATRVGYNDTLHFSARGYSECLVRAYGHQVFLYRPPRVELTRTDWWSLFTYDPDEVDFNKCEVQNVPLGKPAVIELRGG